MCLISWWKEGSVGHMGVEPGSRPLTAGAQRGFEATAGAQRGFEVAAALSPGVRGREVAPVPSSLRPGLAGNQV